MNLLEVTEKDRAIVRKHLELTENDTERDVEILKEWIKKQPHLPQGIRDDVFFENFLIRSKGRVEKAKRCIDSYYSVKVAWPEIYEKLQDFSPSRSTMDMVSILKLTKDHERVIYLRMHENSAENFSMLDSIKVLFAQLEILNKYDYCSGLHVIVDMTNYKMDLLKLTSPFLIKKCLTAITEVYCYRFRGQHFYNPPPWIGVLLNMLKPILKAKLYERIYLHNDLESLTKAVPKEFLPAHLGGGQPPLEDLKDQWEIIMKDQKEYLEDIQKFKSNEKLRIGDCQFDTQMFGIDGTFKKLNVD